MLNGINNPRQIEESLVNAYLARRALDYLVGFNISPILWTKLPGSKSAGRVQSVALKLITEREHEIESFKPEEYWSLIVNFQDEKDNLINSKINVTMIHGQKDEVVPTFFSKQVLKLFNKAKKKIVIIKNGDHSLSNQKQLQRIIRELDTVVKDIS